MGLFDYPIWEQDLSPYSPVMTLDYVSPLSRGQTSSVGNNIPNPQPRALGSTQPQQPEDNWAVKIGDLLQGVGAGIQGKPNPALANRLQRQRLQVQQQELQLKQLKEQTDKIERAMSIFEKAGISDEDKTKVLKAYVDQDPDLKSMFGQHMENVSIAGKEIQRNGYQAAEGELTDPVNGKPLPAGTYDFTAKPVNGKWVYSKIGPSSSDSTKTDNDLAQSYFGKKFADLKGNEQQVFSRLRAMGPSLADLPTGTNFSGMTPEQADAAIQGALDKTSKRTEGRQTRIILAGIENRPMDPGTAQSLSNLYAAQQQLNNIDKNYDKNFLGPIKGTDAAFDVRRRVGNFINSPMGEKETQFRQSLADVKDQLLRARSGAQINEQEYKRLAQMLPNATDEEQVFKASMNRFRDELNGIVATRETLAKPGARGRIGAPGGGAQPTSRTYNFVPGRGLVPTDQ